MLSVRKFIGSSSGNIAAITAIALVPAVIIAGGGYDIMRATAGTTKVQTVLDSAALAAASLSNPQEIATVVDEYIQANLPGHADVRDSLSVVVNPILSLNSKKVEINASATVDTRFLGIVGLSTLPVTAKAIAGHDMQSLEIAMVMDVSSSMKGGKLVNLKNAAADFIDQVLTEANLDHTSINFIPFGGSVNLGSLFEKFVVPFSSATVDPDRNEYGNHASLTTNKFRFSDGDDCLEYKNVDFNDDMLPRFSRNQVPNFAVWWNFRPWCPGIKSSVLLNTNDKQALKDRINEMVLSDGTGLDVGMLWGVKTLSPNFSGELGGDFPDRPFPYEDDVVKVIILMTDGEITHQYRPKDPTLKSVHQNRPASITKEPNVNPEHYGSRQYNRLHGWVDYQNLQRIYIKGNFSSPVSGDTGVSHFKRLCEEAVQNNVIVYTIGFQVRQGHLSDGLLAECASDPSKYYFVEGLDIQSAFDAIAASVNALRIVG